MSGLTGHRMSGHRDAPVLKASQPLRYITRSIWIVPNRFQQEMKKLSCESSSGWCFHRESSGTILVWTSPDSRKCNQGRSHGVGNHHNMVVFTSQWIPGSLGVTNAAFDGYSWKWSRFWKCLDHYGLFKRDFEGRPDVMTRIWQHFREVHEILHKTYDFYCVWTSNKKVMPNTGTSKFPPR